MARSTHSKYFNDEIYARMAEDLHLGGKSERTHAGYLRAVRKLAEYCETSPDKVTEDQLRRFFLYMKNELKAIQKYMGYSSLQTTMIYLHLTETAEVDSRKVIEQMFQPPRMNWQR